MRHNRALHHVMGAPTAGGGFAVVTDPVSVTIDGHEVEVSMVVAMELARLREGVRAAAVVVGEAMRLRLRDEGLDLVDEVLATLREKGRLSAYQQSAWQTKAELLLARREQQRARRADGRG